ncbi:MAG: hypothetical protein CO098_04815, partial [Bacteroidetes bacterium CG_4_9_14_3_um_filter_41_19]
MKTKLLRITFFTLLGLVMLNIQTYANIIFVNENTPATPPNQTGTSWALAFEYMQDALFVAQPGDEIWIAAGPYYPDDSYNNPAIVNGDIGAGFLIHIDLSIYGGFEGWEQSPNQRSSDISLFPTIFSGNIGTNHSLSIMTFLFGISQHLDRVTIESSSNSSINTNVTTVRISDCLIRNCMGYSSITIEGSSNITIENSIIEGNTCTYTLR